MPIENVFAPRVVSPPCATNAWKNKAIALITTVANGPMTIAERGVPTGWDEEPVMGTGMCHTEMTKITAPIRDMRERYDGSSLMRLLMVRSPSAIKSADIKNQNITHCGSRIPSEMCRLCPPNQVKLISLKFT